MPDEQGRYSAAEVEEKVAKANSEAAAANARLELLEEERAERREAAMKPAKESANPAPSNEPRDFSVAELEAAVESGEITAETMQQQLDLQARRAIKREVLAEVKQMTAAERSAEKVKLGIDEFKGAFPELKDKKSKLRARVISEVERLSEDLGLPIDEKTELIAMRTICGDPKVLKREVTRTAIRTEEGVGGGQDMGDEESAGGAPAALDSDRRAYYNHLIGQGMYKGWDDPDLKAEIKILGTRGARA